MSNTSSSLSLSSRLGPACGASARAGATNRDDRRASRSEAGIGWLALGIAYSLAYAAAGFALQDRFAAVSSFRAVALAIPPLVGASMIVVRRHAWKGCQWLFWATIALGLTMSAIGLTGWAAEEWLIEKQTWLAWPAIFALFGNVAPLFALLAQPHRGPREPLAATTSVDIAGLAVVTGFLYSFFVTASDATASLIVVSELQAGAVAAALIAATVVAGHSPWRHTYRRLAFGAAVWFVTLTVSNAQAPGDVAYRSGFVYDFAWILPFAFFPWAVGLSPDSNPDESDTIEGVSDLVRPRPWVIFTAVALLPVLEIGLRRLTPAGYLRGFRDLSTAVAMISVLPLLVARIATERAELQRAGHTTRLLARVIEEARELILVLTPDGRCLHANQAFCRVVGLSRDELPQVPARDLLPSDATAKEAIQTVLSAGGTWRGTMTRRRRDDTTFPVAASVTSVLDERGRVAYIVSVERDLSEERQLREQLIHTERLSAVGQLVAGVAHELNNPLQSVMGITELLLMAETRPDVRTDLEQVRAGSYRAAHIVKGLLAFARRSPVEPAIADLNEIVRSTLELRTYELKNFDVGLQAVYEDPSPLVLVNAEEIQQVVLNLLLNAEQAIRGAKLRPGGMIRVRTGSSAEWVFFEIADNGPGIPNDLIGRIFEPFFTTKEVGQGSGLGLSVSVGIAEAHGGSLELMPTERGACFRLTLPSLPISVKAELTRGAAAPTVSVG